MSDEKQIIYDIPHDYMYVSPQVMVDGHPFYFVNRAGITAQTPVDFHIRRDESYPYNVIHCVTRGKGEVWVRGKRKAVVSGQLFLLRAQEAHEYRSDVNDPLGLCWLEFSGGDSDRLCKWILDRMEPVAEGVLFSKVLSLVSEILMRLESKPSIEISLDIYKILIELSIHTQSVLQVQQSAAYDKMKSIEDYIDQNLASPLTLAQLAKQLNYNPTYFARRFHQIMNITPASFIMQRRISKAKHVLITTNKPLEAVAEALGFCNTSHFIARFKEFEKITPTEYRKQNRFYRQE